MRSPDLNEILYPVELREVYQQNIRPDGRVTMHPVKGSRALVNTETERTISVVSSDYRLVTNQEALDLGIKAFEQLFDMLDSSKMRIFNVITPRSKAYCHIDLIHESYNVNVWDQETYLPYIRVTNSYNRYRALSFDIGFVRELCSNGMIFDKESIAFQYHHTERSLKLGVNFRTGYGKLKRLEEQFIADVTHLREIEVPFRFALAILCRALKIRFHLHSGDSKKMRRAERRFNYFCEETYPIIERYYKQFGENAYALFNAMTEYASSNIPRLTNAHTTDTLQRRAGDWMRSFLVESEQGSFDLGEYADDYKDYCDSVEKRLIMLMEKRPREIESRETLALFDDS